MIKGVTFKNQKFSYDDFSLMIREMYRGHDGIIKGISLSYSGSSVTIGQGYLASSGFVTRILNSETVSTEGLTGSYKLIYEIDLSKEATEEEFLQGSFKLINTDTVQEDLYNGGTIYQLHLANVQISNGVVSSLTKVIERVNPDYYGTWAPSDSIGIDGDVYYQYTE